MPFRDDNLMFIVVPANAGPGQARIVLTSVLPPPLDTYTFTDRAGYLNSYAGGVIFYNDDTSPPIDTTYTYLAVVANAFGSFTAVHMGHVFNGAVREISAGVPAVQIWGGEAGSLLTQKWLSAGLAALEAYSATGEAILRGRNGALVRISTDSGADIIISTSGANGDINLDAAGEIQVQGTRAYLLTQIQTNLCSAALTPIPNAYTLIPGCSITLPTVTANARYKVSAAANVGMNPAGLTIVNVRCLVDGVAQTQQIVIYLDEVQRDTESQFWTGTLAAAGNHTFLIQASDALTSGVCDVAANDTTITVEIWESGG